MRKLLYLSLIAGSLLFTQSCEDKTDPPKPPDNSGTADFVTVNGFTFYGKNATEIKQMINVDTILSYRRVLGPNDTQIFVRHEVRKAKSYNVALVSDIDVDVSIGIGWGSQIGSPSIKLDGGTYKLEKVNGKWVSTLSGGTGMNSATSPASRINNISFKLTWP